MILRSPTESEKRGISVHIALSPIVIPAQAGIQVCFAEWAWIPAFAGMTEPGRALGYHPHTNIFEGVADELDQRRLYRYAEQIRGAGLSPSNNIARPVK